MKEPGAFTKLLAGIQPVVLMEGSLEGPDLPWSEAARHLLPAASGCGARALGVLDRREAQTARLKVYDRHGELVPAGTEILAAAGKFLFDRARFTKGRLELQTDRGPDLVQALDGQTFSVRCVPETWTARSESLEGRNFNFWTADGRTGALWSPQVEPAPDPRQRRRWLGALGPGALWVHWAEPGQVRLSHQGRFPGDTGQAATSLAAQGWALGLLDDPCLMLWRDRAYAVERQEGQLWVSLQVNYCFEGRLSW